MFDLLPSEDGPSSAQTAPSSLAHKILSQVEEGGHDELHLDLHRMSKKTSVQPPSLVVPLLAGGELRRGLVSQYISPQSGVAQIFDHREQLLVVSELSLMSSRPAYSSSKDEAASLMHLLVEQPNAWRTVLVLGALLSALSVFALGTRIQCTRAPYVTITAATTEEDDPGGGATRF